MNWKEKRESENAENVEDRKGEKTRQQIPAHLAVAGGGRGES